MVIAAVNSVAAMTRNAVLTWLDAWKARLATAIEFAMVKVYSVERAIERVVTVTAFATLLAIEILTVTATSAAIATSIATVIEISRDATETVIETVETLIGTAITRVGVAAPIGTLTTAIGRGAGAKATGLISPVASVVIGVTATGTTGMTSRSMRAGGAVMTAGTANIGIGGATTRTATTARFTGGLGPPLRG
jgi:hypothetical protein